MFVFYIIVFICSSAADDAWVISEAKSTTRDVAWLRSTSNVDASRGGCITLGVGVLQEGLEFNWVRECLLNDEVSPVDGEDVADEYGGEQQLEKAHKEQSLAALGLQTTNQHGAAA